MTSTTSKGFFEKKYQLSPDPWNFASSTYEQERYAAILNALEHGRYQRAYEPACSVGVLTSLLSEVCGQVIATDISESAVKLAADRCRHIPNVNISQGALSSHLPDGMFDLILLSEVGYYLPASELRTTALSMVERLSVGGTLLACHWLGQSPDHVSSGDCVHATLRSIEGIHLTREERHPIFRLDVWIRQ